MKVWMEELGRGFKEERRKGNDDEVGSRGRGSGSGDRNEVKGDGKAREEEEGGVVVRDVIREEILVL